MRLCRGSRTKVLANVPSFRFLVASFLVFGVVKPFFPLISLFNCRLKALSFSYQASQESRTQAPVNCKLNGSATWENSSAGLTVLSGTIYVGVTEGGGGFTPLWEVQCLPAMVPWHPDRRANATSPSLLRDDQICATIAWEYSGGA